jgi:hypothetical protein
LKQRVARFIFACDPQPWDYLNPTIEICKISAARKMKLFRNSLPSSCLIHKAMVDGRRLRRAVARNCLLPKE